MNLGHALRQFWLWKRHHVLLSFLLTGFCSVYYFFSPIDLVLLDMAAVLLSFVYLFSVFTKDVFSWKYYQALPFQKRELFHYQILIQYIIYLPFLFWYLCFSAFVRDLLMETNKFVLTDLLYAIPVYLGGCAFVGMMSFYHSYEMFRVPFSKKRSPYHFYQWLRDSLIRLSVLGVAGSLLYQLGRMYPEKANAFFELIEPLLNFWIAFAVIVGITYYFTFRRWLREELSYTKLNFKPLRDIPLMGILILGGTLTVKAINDRVPEEFEETALLRAIYSDDAKEFAIHSKDLLQHNHQSKSGWTPLMLAAAQGKVAFYKELLGAGATRSGIVRESEKKHLIGMDLVTLGIYGNHPEIAKLILTKDAANASFKSNSLLHMAANKCNLENIDLLLELGANPNAQDKNGKTPLHRAVENRCFAGVVSLIEAGGDPLLPNKKGKIARDLLPKYNKDIAYYLEKKGRIPAGK